VTHPADETPTALLRAVRAILRRLVRQLIAHGVTYPSLGRLLRAGAVTEGTALMRPRRRAALPSTARRR
jgi:hypothetical protein